MMKIKLAEVFSNNPFGRYPSDGDNSGERFREEILKIRLDECKNNKDVLYVNIDDIPIGIGSSFLDESFAGLITKSYFTPDELINNLLVIETDDPSYIIEIESYIKEAVPELGTDIAAG